MGALKSSRNVLFGGGRQLLYTGMGKSIVEGNDQIEVSLRLGESYQVTLAELRGEGSGPANRQSVETSAELVELARGIEPPTGGLQICDETNQQDLSSPISIDEK